MGLLKVGRRLQPLNYQKPGMWERLLSDKSKLADLPNIMQLMNVILVLQISTAGCVNKDSPQWRGSRMSGRASEVSTLCTLP